MNATWDHPTWGTFEHDRVRWAGMVEAPAFRAFRWDTDNGRADGPPAKVDLHFESYDEADLPTDGMVAMAERVLAGQAELVPKVTAALWDDFNGRGGDSGMWWHGGLEDVKWVLGNEAVSPPNEADDLLRLMRLAAIVVRPRVYGYEKPIVELSFHAAFEEEHGVGVLTDGTDVLGTGYSIDVTPYKESSEWRRRYFDHASARAHTPVPRMRQSRLTTVARMPAVMKRRASAAERAAGSWSSGRINATAASRSAPLRMNSTS